jgi:hypothetical protein
MIASSLRFDAAGNLRGSGVKTERIRRFAVKSH